MANISAIKLPNGTTYTIVDKTSGYTKNTGTVTSVAASGSGGISISGSPITTSGTIAIGLNLSTAINGLGEGSSPAQRADYIVAQYAGGGTTTTTYHRRSLANIFAALNASDITTALGYTPYNATNPNGYTTNTGTVTSVGTGVGLTGGSITTSGTIKANLTSDTALSNAALSVTEDANRIYPVRIDKNSKLVVVVPWTNVNSSYLTSSSTLNAANLSGAIPSAVTATTQASTDNSTKIATTAYVTTAIANLPEPMIFKGSVGTGGTITSLPTAAASNEGWTYKVITALSSPTAKVGDTVISNGSSWVVIPSGDEPSGTVTSVAASGSGGISISGSPITTSGTIAVSLADAYGDTKNPYGSKTAKYVLAAPSATSGTPSFRALRTDDVTPIATKTFTDVIGTANNWTDATFFFGSVKPVDWYGIWKIKFNIHIHVPGKNTYIQESEVMFSGDQNALRTYSCMNTVANHLVYYGVLYRLKQAGFTNGYGHSIGCRFYSSNYPIDTNYKRTIKVDILETENCTFEFYDNCLKYTSIPGTGTTNYDSYSEVNWVSNGLQEQGDSDTIDDRQTYFSAKTSTSKGIWAGSLFMEDGDGTYQNICAASDGTITGSNRTTATTKVANSSGFRIGGKVFYSNTNYNANTNISGWGVVYNQVSLFDSRYAFNTTLTAGSLTVYKPIYLVGTINNGLFYLDQTWWTQTPENTSKIYILVGGVFDSTTSNCRVSLYQHNPWYYYDGTRLQPYTATANSVAWVNVSGKPTATGSSVTGISIAAHGTGTVIGVQSTTTTASKVTLGTAISVPNVTGNTDVTVPIRADSDTTVPKAASSATTVPIKNASATTVPTAASSATTVPIKDASATSCDDITAWSAGSGSASLTFTMDTTDTKKLKIAFSHSHSVPSLSYTARSIIGVQSTTTSVTGVSGSTSIYGVQSSTTSVTGVSGSTTVRGVKTGDNSTTTASKVTLGTAKSIPNVTAATDVTVPIKNSSASTFVTGTTHTITDNGHTHSI